MKKYNVTEEDLKKAKKDKKKGEATDDEDKKPVKSKGIKAEKEAKELSKKKVE